MQSSLHPAADLPIQLSAAEAPTPAGPELPAPPSRSSGSWVEHPANMRTPKILLVDDHPHKLTALESVLADPDLVLVKANSGIEALRHLLHETFALILMDVNMPGMDGFETAALIRQRPSSEHTPIIFITASAAADLTRGRGHSLASLARGYSLGAVDYLAAPIVPDILQTKVAVFVELFRSNQKVRRQAAELRAFNLDLKVANRRLERQKWELHTSRESFRSIVAKNVEGLAVADAGGVIRFANPAFARLMDRPVEHLIGQPFPYLRETGQAFEMDWVSVGRGKIPVEVFLTDTQWGGEKACLIRVSDISLRRKSEEDLRQSEEKLRQAQRLESIGRLAGGIAHDFNNLLTAINGYAEISLAVLEENHPVRPNLIEVNRAGARAAQLTQQLLAYSRRQILQPREIDLNAVVRGMADMLGHLIGENIELVADLDPHVGLVKVDQGQLEQVIMNLVINAKDAMPMGGSIRVATALAGPGTAANGAFTAPGSAPKEFAALSVSDNGAGMDEHTQSRIFEPFFTTKEVGKGTGLGLSMVYGFLQQSGGAVTVSSSPGAGSTFNIFLPCAAPSGVLLPATAGRNAAGASVADVPAEKEGAGA